MEKDITNLDQQRKIDRQSSMFKTEIAMINCIPYKLNGLPIFIDKSLVLSIYTCRALSFKFGKFSNHERQ